MHLLRVVLQIDIEESSLHYVLHKTLKYKLSDITMTRLVHCIKLDKEAEGLDFPPIPGEMGKKIWENVSKEAWNQWVQHQTMLVNEYRLNLSDIKARKYLVDQMESYFFGSGADPVSGYVPQK